MLKFPSCISLKKRLVGFILYLISPNNFFMPVHKKSAIKFIILTCEITLSCQLNLWTDLIKEAHDLYIIFLRLVSLFLFNLYLIWRLLTTSTHLIYPVVVNLFTHMCVFVCVQFRQLFPQNGYTHMHIHETKTYTSLRLGLTNDSTIFTTEILQKRTIVML